MAGKTRNIPVYSTRFAAKSQENKLSVLFLVFFYTFYRSLIAGSKDPMTTTAEITSLKK